MFFTSYISYKLRLLELKTEGQTIQYKQKTLTRSYKTEIKILANPWLA